MVKEQKNKWDKAGHWHRDGGNLNWIPILGQHFVVREHKLLQAALPCRYASHFLLKQIRGSSLRKKI